MHKRLNPRAAELLAKALSALALVAGVVGFLGIDGPIKWGFATAALASAYWSWRSKWPTLQEMILCAFVVLTVAFGIAWYEGRTGNHSYDFVVTPYKKESTTESWFPAPEHVASDTELYFYGEHVRVECVTENEYEERWYGLPNGNYILAQDLTPSPRAPEDPPFCG